MEQDKNSSGSIMIINYHYCSPLNNTIPGFKGITPDTFEKQIISLKKHYKPLSLDEIPLEQYDNLQDFSFMINFDDGIKDVARYAVPILNKHNIPYTVFCCAQPYSDGKVLNVQKTHMLNGKWGWKAFRKKFMSALIEEPDGCNRDDATRLKLDHMYRYDDADTAEFKRLLNVELPYSVLNRILDKLFEAEFGVQKDVVKYLYMSSDEICRCSEEGGSIGLHTYSHCMLSRLTSEEQENEIDESLLVFRDRLDLEISSISYPYGIKGSWDENTKKIANDRSLKAGFTLGREIYKQDIHSDPMEIPRFDVNDVFSEECRIKVKE